MPVCPICDTDFDAGHPDFEAHVHSHFDQDGDNASAHDDDIEIIGSIGPRSVECFICGAHLTGLGEAHQNAHVSACLDRRERTDHFEAQSLYSSEDEESTQQNGRKARSAAGVLWDGKVFASQRKGKDARVEGDRWWDPVRGGLSTHDLPPNFSPGIVLALKELLLRSVKSKETRRAVLSRHAVHIKGAFGFDGSWGCGYRNAEMSIASLLLLPNSPYTSLFSGESEPSVRTIQNWINEAWRAGYDPAGRAHFKGKIVGTSKWIGPSDLYAMFSYLGVPCTVYDFPKPADRSVPAMSHPEPSYDILLRWVKRYYNTIDPDLQEDGENSDSFLCNTPPVRISDQLPLMLQHNGHSRTIVGYEEDFRGRTKLLLLDPGKAIPKHVREDGLKLLKDERTRASSTPVSALESASDDRANEDGTNKIREGADAAQPTSDDEVGPDGWVKRKIKKPKSGSALSTSLSVFRMKPQREQKEFQVLAFPGTELLSLEQRADRRKPKSVRVIV
ncbi:DUF1671-domain-containing protein [Cutaneotrichosporon oleaginosum]|uniref:DUF1671-domain-containing protein n=1 Tax=Cutaneotrichosporon oleaginosum TaxID=879819 RepID=A0A0J0XCG2_9TREE|nr:DUF1671-domain-containing protein [Cutaneotrichosporon oleaginosum]KLT38768.1 DUF1671-domain-containing protein [Cutaneotrichosporon oleaginosum]TXT11494.1 hypothetical protein COLE_01904 [Cutaneotrichosporon oleaginosum]